jgi:ArsR family transcriptional regulator
MDIQELAVCLGKLGNSTRLQIFQLLVRAGPQGLSVGEIQEFLRIPGSTLSHHILFLASSHLIFQERHGRVLRCRPNFERMSAIVDALTAECCKGVNLLSEAKPAKGRRSGKRSVSRPTRREPAVVAAKSKASRPAR